MTPEIQFNTDRTFNFHEIQTWARENSPHWKAIEEFCNHDTPWQTMRLLACSLVLENEKLLQRLNK